MRTSKLMVKRLFGKMGDILSCKNLFGTVDEADAWESLKEVAEKKINNMTEGQARLSHQLRVEKALDHSLQVAKDVLANFGGMGSMLVPLYSPATVGENTLATSVTSLGLFEPSAAGQAWPSQRAPAPSGEAALDIELDSEDGEEAGEAKYVVADCKSRAGGRVARLHLRRGCHLGRTLAFASYELLHADPPPARSYTDFCKRCWPRGSPDENKAELTSDSDGETTSSASQSTA